MVRFRVFCGQTTKLISPGKSAAVEKRLFLGRRDAAEHRVAMREAAETADDVAVHLRILERAGIVRAEAELAAALLVGERLRVHVGQIEELPFRLVDLSIEAARDRASGRSSRERISGECRGAAAKHVARELVEYDNLRECAGCVAFPLAEHPGGCCGM